MRLIGLPLCMIKRERKSTLTIQKVVCPSINPSEPPQQASERQAGRSVEVPWGGIVK